VQQRGAGGGLRARAELLGHHRGQPRALDGVGEHVLAVARAELQAPERADDLAVQALDVAVEGGLLAGLDEARLELGLRLVVGLLDARRVDAPVGQQLLERHARDLSAYAVEGRQDDGAGGVVDDEVHAGEVLQRTDVAPLPADDPALHLVGGQLHDRHRGLDRVAGGEALHRDRQDRPHAALGVALGLLLDLAHVARALVAHLVGDLVHQPLLGLAGAQPGDPLERLLVLARAAGELLAFGLERAGLVVELARAAVELLGADADALLEARELLADGGGRLGIGRIAAAPPEAGDDRHAEDRRCHDQFHVVLSSSPRARARARPRGAIDVRGRTGRASGGSRRRVRRRALRRDVKSGSKEVMGADRPP
jgi:hypothetical protein